MFVCADAGEAVNQATIAAYQRRHKYYDVQSRMSDGFVKRDAFRISDDGNFIEFPHTGKRRPIE